MKLPPVCDLAEWEQDFGRWALAHCLFLDKCWWQAEALHDHFCDTLNAEGLVPCNLPTFAALLASEGLTITAGLVYGLVLKEEYSSLTSPQRREKAAPSRAVVCVGSIRKNVGAADERKG